MTIHLNESGNIVYFEQSNNTSIKQYVDKEVTSLNPELTCPQPLISLWFFLILMEQAPTITKMTRFAKSNLVCFEFVVTIQGFLTPEYVFLLLAFVDDMGKGCHLCYDFYQLCSFAVFALGSAFPQFPPNFYQHSRRLRPWVCEFPALLITTCHSLGLCFHSWRWPN